MSTQNTNTVASGKATSAFPTSAIFPIWRIQGTWTLTTPLHLGSGHDDMAHTFDPSAPNNTRELQSVAQLATDFKQLPYIPASSYRGALRHLAAHYALEQKEAWERLFGSVNDNISTPAHVEFCNAYAVQAEEVTPKDQRLPEHAYTPHVVRNRDTGTAEDGKLFITQQVPVGRSFAFECTVRGDCEADIAQLLTLLEATSSTAEAPSSPFQLGGKKAADLGRVTWQLKQVQQFKTVVEWIKRNHSPIQCKLDDKALSELQSKASALQIADQSLHLSNLTLNFTTPFISHTHNPAHKKGDNLPQGTSRTNSQGQYILPSTSLHGALRAQAEVILRTVGINCPAGYEVEAVNNMEEVGQLDLASLLFGAPGWRSVVQCTDFAIAKADAKKLPHEMIAIDRITGGGKNHAKFSLEVLDCPTLTGRISIDRPRLQALDESKMQQALGLLAHVLRDLDEGDIPLGYGASKGYGVSTSECWKQLNDKLPSFDICLTAFAQLGTQKSSIVIDSTRKSEPTAIPRNTSSAGDHQFHNPYVFLPFATNTDGDDLKRDIKHADIPHTHHSHAQYSAQSFHGRLEVKLTTTTPIFVGAQRGEPAKNNRSEPTEATPVVPFKLRNAIALPATGLRGMLSSLHESISRSAMRVAGNAPMSVRAAASEALPLYGTLVVADLNGKRVACAKCAQTGKLYQITKSAQNTLHALADLRYAQDPSYPKWDTQKTGLPDNGGRVKENDWSEEGPPRLKFGSDALVFFRLDKKTRTKVDEIAWSQIWRKAIARKDNNQQFLGHYLPQHATPAMAHPLVDSWGRSADKSLTPTEWMFGFVQEKTPSDKDSAASAAAISFASKVRIGWGTCAVAVRQTDEVTLKVLATPKPPSPAMYKMPIKGKDAYVSKMNLATNPSNYAYRGRKVYLHGLRSPNDKEVQGLDAKGMVTTDNKSEPWRTRHEGDNLKQKVRIKPIDANQAFTFPIDFKNLSQAELESLCATVLPHESYAHKLGMGKPVGMGSVKLSIDSLQLIDRQARYKQTDFSKALRFNLSTTPNDASRMARHMMAALEKHAPALYRAIVITGDPSQVKAPVHYPQVRGADIEKETYQWFVDNDKQTTPQHLKAFDETSDCLHTLKRN